MRTLEEIIADIRSSNEALNPVAWSSHCHAKDMLLLANELEIASRGESKRINKYIVLDGSRTLREFKTKRNCRSWLMDGIFSCEGAERDHYVNMLAELECGKKTLHY